MKPSQSIKKAIFLLICSISLSAAVFADDSIIINNITINEKLLQSFKKTFPDAVEVKWLEQADKYTVNFKESGILTKIDYDKDGNFISSLRYYSEKNLPVNILCKLQKRYAGKKVFGVTEMTNEATVEYYIKMEDEKYWYTIKSNTEGSLQQIEKYNKAL